MKKQLIAMLSTMAIFSFGIILTVNAADYAVPPNAIVTLKSDKAEVKPGDTFTVTFGATCEEGINGVSAKISYEEDKLELVDSITVTDTSKWSNLGEGLLAEIIHASNDTIKTGDIFKLTFKVKDNTEVGTSAKVTASEIMIDSDAAQNSENNIGTKETSVLVKDQVNTKPDNNKPDNTEPDNTEPDSNKPGNTTSENKESGNTANSTPENKTEDKTNAIENKDTTQSHVKTIPYTGRNILVVISVVAVGTIAIVSYVEYKKYKNI